MGGLLVDAMVNPGDGSKKDSTSAPLMVVENGCGSPCIDLRQVSSELAAAAKEADLVYTKHLLCLYFGKTLKHSDEISFGHCLTVLQVILEGMGRALHTNFNAQFKCESLKV